MLEIASTNGEAIFLANNDNWWSSIRPFVYTNYYWDDIATFDSMISAGDTLLLPQFGYNCLGEGTWCGYGLVDYRSPGNLSTFIQGYFFGGQVSDSNAVVAPKYVAATSQAQPRQATSNHRLDPNRVSR